MWHSLDAESSEDAEISKNRVRQELEVQGTVSTQYTQRAEFALVIIEHFSQICNNVIPPRFSSASEAYVPSLGQASPRLMQQVAHYSPKIN